MTFSEGKPLLGMQVISCAVKLTEWFRRVLAEYCDVSPWRRTHGSAHEDAKASAPSELIPRNQLSLLRGGIQPFPHPPYEDFILLDDDYRVPNLEHAWTWSSHWRTRACTITLHRLFG